MKKILKSLFTILAVVVLMGASTQAVWSDEGEIGGNYFTTGNADIKLSDGHGWQDNISTFTADDIYPGWTEDFTFYVMNDSDSDIILDIVAKLSTLGGTDWGPGGALVDELKLQFTWGGGNSGTWSLRQWYEGQDSLGSLAKGDDRTYTASFSLPSDVDNDLQDKDVNFTVLLTGTQQ